MAVRARFLQIGIALVNIAIVGLVFTSIWPFPSGEFKVDLPSANNVTWDYSNGLVNVSAPYAIHNGWIYDVNDLVITYRVTNVTGELLGQGNIDVGTIPADSVKTSSLNFTFDLIKFYNEGGLGMIFMDDTLRLEVGVSCMYTMKLISFNASYEAVVPWDALIRSYNATVSQNGSQLLVNYHLDTSPMLARLGTVPLVVWVNDTSGNPIASPVLQEVPLGGPYDGSFQLTPTIPVTPTTAIVVSFSLLGFHFEVRLP